jgi:hypothetical protein
MRDGVGDCRGGFGYRDPNRPFGNIPDFLPADAAGPLVDPLDRS